MFKIIALLVLLSVSMNCLANQVEGIEVKGKSSVMVAPDTYTLTINIKERGKSASKIKALVDDKSTRIVKMFVKHGIKQQDINSANVRMFPLYEKPSINLENSELQTKFNKHEKITFSNQKNKRKQKTSVIRFEVSRTITVTFKKISIYDHVLDDLVKLGVSQISPLEISISEQEKYYEQALMQAIENAENKALKIAQKANVEIGKLKSLTESGYHSPSVYRMASDAGGGFNSQVVNKAITAQVIAIYNIVQ